MLNTLKSVPNEDPAYHYFSPEDLALNETRLSHGLRGAADGGANSSAANDVGQGNRLGF